MRRLRIWLADLIEYASVSLVNRIDPRNEEYEYDTEKHEWVQVSPPKENT